MNVSNSLALLDLSSLPVLLRSADGAGGPGAGGGGGRLPDDGTRLHGNGRAGNLP